VAIEAHAGLTDAYIAHLPISKRGRPGHEKQAPPDYLQKRRVNFVFTIPQALPKSPRALNHIRFGYLDATILCYDRRVMDQLKKFAEVQFDDFPSFFDRYIEKSYNWPLDEVQNRVGFFKRFYFNHNDDPKRLAKLRTRLGS